MGSITVGHVKDNLPGSRAINIRSVDRVINISVRTHTIMARPGLRAMAITSAVAALLILCGSLHPLSPFSFAAALMKPPLTHPNHLVSPRLIRRVALASNDVAVGALVGEGGERVRPHASVWTTGRPSSVYYEVAA